jgi:hypothetical protein
MSDPPQEYSDWLTRFNVKFQGLAGFIFGLGGCILLSPLLVFRSITVDRIVDWLTRVTDIAFRGLPIFFLPFFALHEILHIVFMAFALLHPQIEFEKWLWPKFHTKETFSMGMMLNIPEESERSPLIAFLAILICIAPILGFIPSIWAITHTDNPYILTYLLLGSLWCIPSDIDRMEIRNDVRLLLKK